MINNVSAEKPGRMAWFVFRSLARYLVSLFIPTFRFFGETAIANKKQIFIIKNYGFQSWAYPLSIFNRPMRFIVADLDCDMQWFNTAKDGGLFPILLSGNSDSDAETFKQALERDEKIVLIIPKDESNESSANLLKTLKKDYGSSIFFMAISSGAERVFANNAIVPKISTVTMVCGNPFISLAYKDVSIFKEFHALEKSAESATDITEPYYLAYLMEK